MHNQFLIIDSHRYYNNDLLAISIESVLFTKTILMHSLNEDETLENRQALNSFLSAMERRAFRMAELATGNHDRALEIVQDSMFALVKKYSHKNESEWGPLFHRILQSKIRDWYRRSKVRNSIFGILHLTDDYNDDPVQIAEDKKSLGPEQTADNNHMLATTLSAIRALPLRQQQAFLLRAWEGYDVKETAKAMGCSQGSVKTHYSRAINTLKHQLETYQA